MYNKDNKNFDIVANSFLPFLTSIKDAKNSIEKERISFYKMDFQIEIELVYWFNKLVPMFSFRSNRQISNGYGEGFDCIKDENIKKLIIESHKKVDAKHSYVGYEGNAIKIIYYFDRKPNIRKGIDVYGGMSSVSLDEMGLVVQSDENHTNIIAIYNGNQILGLYGGIGYIDCHYVFEIERFVMGSADQTDFDKWVHSLWSTYCEEKNYKELRRIPSRKSIQSITNDFMLYMKNNQNKEISYYGKK